MHSSAPRAGSADAANAAEIADRLAALSMHTGGLIAAPAAAANLAPGSTSSRASSSSSSSHVSSHTSPHASPLLPLGAAVPSSARPFASTGSPSPWAPTVIDQKFAAPFPTAVAPSTLAASGYVPVFCCVCVELLRANRNFVLPLLPSSFFFGYS